MSPPDHHNYNTLHEADVVKSKPSARQTPTMDPRTWFRDLTGYFLYILFIATLGPLLFGYHLAELNTRSDVIACKPKSSIDTDSTSLKPTLPPCLPMNPAQLGLITSIFTLGGLIGALSIGSFAHRYGRLRCMRSTTLPFIVGPIFEALAPNIGVMVIGRFISGLGAGAALVVVPIYVSEVAPPAEKGFFGAFTQVMINMGIFTALLLGYFFNHGQLWRLVLAVGGAVGLAQLAGLLLSVESPRWTAQQGRLGAARKVLARIRGHKFDVEEEVAAWGVTGDAHEQREEEEETLLSSADVDGVPRPSGEARGNGKAEPVTMYQALVRPEHTRATLAVIGTMLAQQFTGINSIVMYGVDLLADLMQSNSQLLNIAVSVLNIVVTAAAAPLVDRLGRRTCLLASITGMGFSSVLLALGILKAVPVLSAVAALLFVTCFALGLGPVPFILASELVGPEAVSATQSWALAANWSATFVVAQFFPVVNAWLGKGKVYFVFAALAVVFVAFVARCVPESKGKANADEVWGRERRED